MSSPELGSQSSDTTPLIKGSGFFSFAGQNIDFYSDSNCTNFLGTAKVQANGETTTPEIEMNTNGSDDGDVRIYAKVSGQSAEAENCKDSGLHYSLNTNIPLAESHYYRLTWSEDPSTSMVVGFSARVSNQSDAKVYFDTENHGRDVKSYRQVKAIDTIRTYLRMNNAFVRLTNLKPNTVYYFVVQDGRGVSPTFSFKTAPNDPTQRLSIIAGGDSRNNRMPRRNANLLVAKLRPHFVFFGGDMTASGTETEWRQWFEDWQLTTGPGGRLTPIVPARGNHESSNKILEAFFDTHPGVYYGLSFGGNLLRAYTLNTESAITGEQTSWLTADLSRNSDTVWKLAQYHRPMRPHVTGKSEGNTQYKAWAEPFYKYGMDLVVESDAHTVKLTWPIRPSSSAGSHEGFIRDDTDGTVYIGEGCWGAPLRKNNDIKPWTRDSGVFNHFNLIHVDRTKMEIRTIKVDNAFSVGQNTDQNIFHLPDELSIWEPSNGSVITLRKK